MLRSHAAAIAVLALLVAGPAQALVVDPITGGDGLFYWDNGVGESVLFGDRPNGDDALEITLATDSEIGIFAVSDCCAVGDSFLLVVDGSQVAWTSAGFDGTTSLYEAQKSGLMLAAGPHTIDLVVATTAPGFASGDGFWSLSSAVPEPSSALLACVGALVLRGAFRRRKAIS